MPNSNDNINPAPGFSGGCRKKLDEEGVCLHYNPDGKVVMKQKTCPNYAFCPGENFKFKGVSR
jgi:hypothetical protein